MARLKMIVVFLIVLIIVVLTTSDVLSASLGDKTPNSSPQTTPTALDLRLDDLKINQVIQFIADTQNTPRSNLFPVNVHVRNYPELGKSVLIVTVFDISTSQIFDASLDLADSKVYATQVFETANSKAVSAKYGKIDPQLFYYLENKSDEELVRVVIWIENRVNETVIDQLRFKYPQISENISYRPWANIADQKIAKDVKQEYLTSVVTANKLQQQKLQQDIKEFGYSVFIHTGTPTIEVALPKKLIIAMAMRNDINSIYLAEGEISNLLTIAVPTTKVDAAWNAAILGTGQRVAILEYDTVSLNHSSINVIAVRDENPLYHASGVASAIASFHPVFKGMAPEAEIVSAGFDVSDGTYDDVADAIWWAYSTYGVQIMNASLSTVSGEKSDNMEWIDRVFDYYARQYDITMIASAGNQEFGNHIGSPGKGYNVLTVGGMNDSRTIAWYDDSIAGFSSWENPKTSSGVNGDREKPEVVASAVNLTLLNNDNQTFEKSGTSFSAPLVTGEAALLSNNDSRLYSSPEALRAIIMGTAWHNVDGPLGIPTGIDLKDGAGAIDVQSAIQTSEVGFTTNSEYPYPPCEAPCWWFNYTDRYGFDAGNYRLYKFNAKAGEHIRVALVWSSNPAGPGGNYGMDPLDTNLDLVVFDPQMQFANNGYSASNDNSYELVDFYSQKTGTYTIGVYKRRMDEVGLWFGLAWSKGYNICFVPFVSNAVNTTKYLINPYPSPGEMTPNTTKSYFSPYPAP